MLARCLEPLPYNYSLIYSLHQELSTYSGVCAQALAGVLIALALVRMMKCIQYEGKIGLVTRVLVGTHSSTLSHDQSLARDGLVTTDTAKRWLSQYCCELAATKSKFGQLLTLTRSSPHSHAAPHTQTRQLFQTMTAGLTSIAVDLTRKRRVTY